MPVPTWIRDILGIRKDFVETKKALLEIARLQDEKSQRELITRASMADIEKYDANTRFLLRAIAEDYAGSKLEGDLMPYGGADIMTAIALWKRLKETLDEAEWESDEAILAPSNIKEHYL